VRIGVVSTLFRNTPEPMVQVITRPLRALLESQTGTPGQIVLGGEALALARKVNDGQVDFGVFHGHELAWARKKYPSLKPVLIAVNRHRYVQARAVVRKDHRAASVADLAGEVAAVPSQAKEHCRLFFERRCTKDGQPPARFFREVTAPADGEDALDDVVDRKAAVAVVDLVDLESYRKAKPGRARHLRELLVSEELPCGALVVSEGRLGDADVQRIRDGLIAARSTARGRQMLQLMKLTAFEGVPAGYEASLDPTLRAYPPPPER
jgi:ABC-type phosphate/phosphonate transport system substrate-binding protein